jgi:hypothetical protein
VMEGGRGSVAPLGVVLSSMYLYVVGLATPEYHFSIMGPKADAETMYPC